MFCVRSAGFSVDQRDLEEFVKPSGSAGGSPAIISNECETSLVMLRLAETSFVILSDTKDF